MPFRKMRIYGPWVLTIVLLIVATGVPVARAQTYTDLYNFDGVHGDRPNYPQVLAQGRDGNLYGTTLYGGTQDAGVVFKVTPDGSLTVLYNFDDGVNGGYSFSGLTLGTDGNLYGTTDGGGTNGFGTIFKITPSGSLTTLYSFTGGADGSEPSAPPIQGTDGNFYGTSGNATAYRIAPSGIFTTLASLPGQSVAPLLQATDRNFYGTTYSGGSSNDGTVFKMKPDGTVTTVYNFDSTHGSAPNASLTQAGDGNFYGTTVEGGTKGAGVVFKLTPTGVIKVLHNFDKPYAPFAGLVQATDGNFYYPVGGPSDVSFGSIFKISPDGAYSLLYNLTVPDGTSPWATPLQHTNGKIYGLTDGGGSFGGGVVYSFDAGLAPFAGLLPTAGKAGRVIDVPGQGFTGTTAVSFNGAAATFKVESDTYLRAIVPSGATTGVVTVTTPSGPLTSNQPFRVTQ
ncbi:MAG: choice-of-anchor tandem repeat GloVer-containing protein [Terriglobia bacterium]